MHLKKIFINWFSLVRVAVVPEPIPGPLMKEYSLDGMPLYHRAPCMHTFTHPIMPKSNFFSFPNALARIFLGDGRKPMWTWGKPVQEMTTMPLVNYKMWSHNYEHVNHAIRSDYYKFSIMRWSYLSEKYLILWHSKSYYETRGQLGDTKS